MIRRQCHMEVQDAAGTKQKKKRKAQNDFSSPFCFSPFLLFSSLQLFPSFTFLHINFRALVPIHLSSLSSIHTFLLPSLQFLSWFSSSFTYQTYKILPRHSTCTSCACQRAMCSEHKLRFRSCFRPTTSTDLCLSCRKTAYSSTWLWYLPCLCQRLKTKTEREQKNQEKNLQDWHTSFHMFPFIFFFLQIILFRPTRSNAREPFYFDWVSFSFSVSFSLDILLNPPLSDYLQRDTVFERHQRWEHLRRPSQAMLCSMELPLE